MVVPSGDSHLSFSGSYRILLCHFDTIKGPSFATISVTGPSCNFPLFICKTLLPWPNLDLCNPLLEPICNQCRLLHLHCHLDTIVESHRNT